MEGTNLCVNVSSKQIFNAALGQSMKEAAENRLVITMVGYAITETVDPATGETKQVSVIVDKDGTLYSGISQVTENRLRQIHATFSEEEIMNGLEMQFCTIKAGRGTGVSLMML